MATTATKATSSKTARASTARKTTSRASTTRAPRASTTRASTARKTTTRRAPSQPDAVAVLKADHRTVEQLFKAFEKAGDGALKTKRKLVDQMITELSIHAAIEEEVFYPAARQEVPDSLSDVLEAMEEHHVVKWELSELDGMDPADERFEPKVTVMMENVRHHVREEEGELFPLVRANLGRKRLVEIGGLLQAAKRGAPTHPHPRSPDHPPANLLPNALAGAVDRARDLVTR
jgi:hemerythrin superfamily protein